MSSPQERANDTAIEALKQALTLASLILGLTVTFIKDVIGDSRSLAICLWMIPLAWACLVVSIWTAWVAIAQAAREIGNYENQEAYVFKRGPTRVLAKIAQWTFCVGLSCLALFGVINFRLLLNSNEGPALKEKDQLETPAQGNPCTQDHNRAQQVPTNWKRAPNPRHQADGWRHPLCPFRSTPRGQSVAGYKRSKL